MSDGTTELACAVDCYGLLSLRVHFSREKAAPSRGSGMAVCMLYCLYATVVCAWTMVGADSGTSFDSWFSVDRYVRRDRTRAKKRAGAGGRGRISKLYRESRARVHAHRRSTLH